MMSTIRAAVIAAAKARKITAYALARDTKLSGDTVRLYLKGETDMRSENLDLVLATLGLAVRNLPKPDLPKPDLATPDLPNPDLAVPRAAKATRSG